LSADFTLCIQQGYWNLSPSEGFNKAE
jgi:hypothetical protein